MVSSSTGTTFANVSKKQLHELKFFLPPIKKQLEIADLIKTLDDKIVLNIQTNQTLEEMAMTLYKHWFVDFGPFQDGDFVESELGMVPKGWNVQTLNQLVKTQYGYTASANDKEVGPHFLRITDIQNNFIKWSSVPYCEIDEKNYMKYQLKKGDIVIARTGNSTGTVGYVNTNIRGVFASFLVRLQPKTKEISPHYLFLLAKSQNYQNYLLGASSGTTRKGANAQLMTEYKIALPPQEIIRDFHNRVDSILEQIELNIAESTQLELTRDYLLPKLLSGEIDLTKVEKEVVKAF